jgi:type IV secretion system protein VirB2
LDPKTVKHHRKTIQRLVAAMAASACFCGAAHAQSGALPWEAPLAALQNSLTGPIAKAIGVSALAVAGGMLAFGGELADFTKRILMVVLALAVMLLAGNFVTALGLP